MMMMCRVVVGIVVAAVASGSPPATAAVFCKGKKSAVFVRESCRAKETQLVLADFGATGPKGDKGDQGDQGDPGDAFSVTSTLQPGQSLSGPWSVGAGNGGWAGTSIQFRLPLAAPIALANVHYLADGAAPTADCPGYGQAAAGHLCVYTNEGTGNLAFSSIYHNEGNLDASVAGAGIFGFHLFFSSTAADTYLSGSYTVTAP
jgi:hypothetical protein